MAAITRTTPRTVAASNRAAIARDREQDERPEADGPAPEPVEVTYTAQEIADWTELTGGKNVEKIALSDLLIKASYCCLVAGNLLERVELTGGAKSKANPNGLWYAYRFQLIRSVGPFTDDETGEVIQGEPGDFALVPETAKLIALAHYTGKAVALRPIGQKRLDSSRNPMWLYEAAVISQTPVKIGG